MRSKACVSFAFNMMKQGRFHISELSVCGEDNKRLFLCDVREERIVKYLCSILEVEEEATSCISLKCFGKN